AYQRLNRWDQSAGATYTWVARVFHPYLGFLAGWMILLYYTLGTTTLTIPAGVYTVDLIAPSLIDNHWAIFAAGAFWNALITALAILGLRLVARFEWLTVVFQYTVLLIVAVVALRALAHGRTAAGFSWSWFSWTSLGGMKGLIGGILIACFMYSGWDASIYVNEETADRANNPGKAALASVVMLALVYSAVTFAFQSVLSAPDMQAHAGNVLSAVSGRLLGKPWDSIMSLVVLTGTLATLQAAIVSAARVGRAMSRDRVMPAFFQRVTRGGPWAATLTMGAINLALLGLALGTSGIAAALSNAASSLGLISLMFYGLTAAAALWQQRGALLDSRANLLLGGLLPLLGVLFSAWVTVESLLTGAVSSTVMLYGFGSLVAGAAVALILHRCMHIDFFDSSRQPRSAA
ncbi:MAG TPA: APC family permease, partial [Steroidobacteraceae bacterium]|nr:APC family permease [Steroidobacteraceae bacterium]